MRTRVFCLFVSLLLLAWAGIAAETTTVAVMDFANHTGSSGLAYLSDSLPEALSTTLANMEELRVVERGQLDKVLEEIELELSDLFDESEASRVGKLAEADVLLLGSYSGDPEEIILSLKAVEVDTSRVLTGRVVRAPLGQLFDRAHQAAILIGNIIAGKEVGSLSVSTTPDGAEIFIDGMQVGESPLVEFKLIAGSHRVKAVKSGYLDEETVITIEEDELEVWKPVLIEQRAKNRTEVGLGTDYLLPLHSEIKGSPYFTLLLGHNFDRWLIDGKIGYGRIGHGETIDSPFGDIEQERWYNYLTLSASLSYIFGVSSRIIRPYVGGFAGWGNLVDVRRNDYYENGKETIRVQSLWTMGVKAGTLLAPFSKVSLFIEGRGYFSPFKIMRREYESPGLLGDLVSEDKEFNYFAVSIGGGLKYYF